MPFFKRRTKETSYFEQCEKSHNIKHRSFFAAIIIVVIIALLYIFSQKVGELIIKLSEWKITDTIDILVNEAVYDKIDELDLNYSDIINLERDSAGRVTALSTNIVYVNKLKTKIINEIYDRIPEAENDIVYVPLANIIGSKILSGSDLYIPVKILSVTNIESNLSNDLSDTGINQSYHRIFFDINVELSVLIPGYKGTTHVDTRVLLAETVIVGDVPNTYFKIN